VKLVLKILYSKYAIFKAVVGTHKLSFGEDMCNSKPYLSNATDK